MKSNLKSIDGPEFDEFFRRGEESPQGADSVQPTVSFDDSNADSDARVVRTPAQRARRAKAIKFVSMTIALLTIGTAGALAREAMKGEQSRLAQARPAPAPSVVPAASFMQSDARMSGKVESVPGRSPETDPGVPPFPVAKVGPAIDQPRTSSQVAPAPGASIAALVSDKVVAVPADPAQSDPLKATSTESQPAKTDRAGLVRAAGLSSRESGKGIAGSARASLSTSTVQQRAAPAATNETVSRAGRSSVRPRTAVAKTTAAKPIAAKPTAAKPENYHPPTASFADL